MPVTEEHDAVDVKTLWATNSWTCKQPASTEPDRHPHHLKTPEDTDQTTVNRLGVKPRGFLFR